MLKNSAAIRLVNLSFIAFAIFFASSAVEAYAPITAEQIKTYVQYPLPLLGVMFLASLGSAFKQMVVARRSGAPISMQEYFVEHWPETVVMLGTNAAFWLGLIMTDSLDWKTALGLGYVANDAADLFTKEGRSASVAPPPPKS